MIVTCPECETRFVVPDEEIGTNGRTVRCSQCSVTWYVAHDPDILELQDNQSAKAHELGYDPARDDYDHKDVPETSVDIARDGESFSNPVQDSGPGVHTVLRESSDRKKARRRIFGVGMIWIVTLLLLIGFAVTAYVLRTRIIEKFPGTEQIYNAFGTEVTTSGLEFYEVEGSFGTNEGIPIMAVSGKIRNYDTRTRPVSLIKLTFKNANGESIGTWAIEPPQSSLAAGESLKFSAEYPNPPVETDELSATFLDENMPIKN